MAYLPIILVSMSFNYVVGVSLVKAKEHTRVRKKTLLVFGIIANVALLAYFKYADFLIENVNMAIDGHLSLLHLVLPLAISFFTFQQIAYLVDSYRGETREYNFLNYANFVAFFPQLIAGPIVHHKEMMPQFLEKNNFRPCFNWFYFLYLSTILKVPKNSKNEKSIIFISNRYPIYICSL